MGAMLRVETTAAAAGEVGVLRYDPMAMKPFCGYHIADYFRHWLSFRSKSENLPRIFQINAFRMGKDGRFLWPGYGNNLVVLKWILDRCKGAANAAETPIGYVPTPDSLNLSAMNLPGNIVEELLKVDEAAWMDEIESSELFFKTLGEQFPDILWGELSKLRDRLQNPTLAPHH